MRRIQNTQRNIGEKNLNNDLIMYFRIKVSNMPDTKGIVTFLIDETNFALASYKVINLIGTDADIEEIKLMKNFKPAINEKYDPKNKLYMVKIAEDITGDDGCIKTLKYELPVFANNSNELYDIVNDYIRQGLNNMRLTTISETKWKYID